MRTTKKEFKDLIQSYIMYILDDEETEVLEEQLQNVIDGFNNWYCAYEQKRTPNKYSAFREWFQGLPSQISVEYRLYKIEELLVSWFDFMGETYKIPKNDDKTYDLYYHLVTRELYTLCRKHNISI